MGIVFDLLKVGRIITGAHIVLTALFDTVFLVILCIVMLLFILTLGEGEPRMYIILGMTLGAWLYFLTLSPLIIKAGRALFRVITEIVRLILKPFVFLFKIFSAIIAFCKNIGKNFSKTSSIFPAKGVEYKEEWAESMGSGRGVAADMPTDT